MSCVLITGGAGFIGSHLADTLLASGHDVRVLDVLDAQVHPGRARPAYLDRRVDLRVGDVRDELAVRNALDGVDAVCHLAAAVGVGQSMYQIRRYVDVNDVGTATLLDALSGHRTVRRLVVASSMSVYGEGQYVDAQGRPAAVVARSVRQLRAGEWDVHDADGGVLSPVPTTEDKPVALTSVYAVCKYAQERLCLAVGEAYDVPTIALRFFNVYGTRQALTNPYTGVLAIFASRLLNGHRPVVYEDGAQLRDFVSVHDVAAACRLALDAPPACAGVFNIGSGRAVTISEVARRLAEALGLAHVRPDLSGRYRVGDIRHCCADITAARTALRYAPSVPLDDGLRDLVTWLRTQRAVDRFNEAADELAARGLTA
jgi:dTDP-L-rhamnose 4-epimerase